MAGRLPSIGIRVGLILFLSACVPLNCLRLQNLTAHSPSGSPCWVMARLECIRNPHPWGLCFQPARPGSPSGCAACLRADDLQTGSQIPPQQPTPCPHPSLGFPLIDLVLPLMPPPHPGALDPYGLPRPSWGKPTTCRSISAGMWVIERMAGRLRKSWLKGSPRRKNSLPQAVDDTGLHHACKILLRIIQQSPTSSFQQGTEVVRKLLHMRGLHDSFM